MQTKRDIIKLIQQNIEVVKAYGVKKMGIFGSVAKASQRHNSDIDILVESAKPQSAAIFLHLDNYLT